MYLFFASEIVFLELTISVVNYNNSFYLEQGSYLGSFKIKHTLISWNNLDMSFFVHTFFFTGLLQLLLLEVLFPHPIILHVATGGAPTQGTSWWCRNLIDFRPPNQAQFKHCFAFVSFSKKSHDHSSEIRGWCLMKLSVKRFKLQIQSCSKWEMKKSSIWVFIL